jgi:hypothetical protein
MAKVIMEKIQLRGYSLHLEGLLKETSCLDGLIQDLKDSKMQTIMEQLGVKSYYDAMVAAEDEYKRVDTAHSRASTTVSDSVSIVEARRIVRTTYEQCYWWLHRQFQKHPAEMTPMVRRWNAIFTDLTADARARATRESNAAASTQAKTVETQLS